jgi:RNA polymerase sigma-70 factor, ECF subfamily
VGPGVSYEELYRRSYGRLVGQLVLVTGDLDAAQDVVQEAMYRAWSRWDTVGSLEDPTGWIRRVAFNEATTRWRKLRRMVTARDHDLVGIAAVEVSPQDLDLLAALRRLPMRQREALVLFYLIGLPLDEVAGEMRIRLGTAKSFVSRGRGALRQAMTESTERGEVRATH